ncbi:uncharacterized protein F4807DRAFT_182796 [Annulohypoxylon truncatum]|uniref:uncharacterized protein n=1 Tax=Annulohypoxylon truncatum TaxID=327061 RepID=UPI0020084366|nr:uncharacterized protein F4807DRAFT_182796 [Annulohypoxylon truncatum]KAI1207276.1 hypothetical protein F4807DRAFT_182796 [Annulohypoxylon truncatum]
MPSPRSPLVIHAYAFPRRLPHMKIFVGERQYYNLRTTLRDLGFPRGTNIQQPRLSPLSPDAPSLPRYTLLPRAHAHAGDRFPNSRSRRGNLKHRPQGSNVLFSVSYFSLIVLLWVSGARPMIKQKNLHRRRYICHGSGRAMVQGHKEGVTRHVLRSSEGRMERNQARQWARDAPQLDPMA